MIDNSVRHTAFRLIESRKHKPKHEQELWLFYYMGSGYKILNYEGRKAITRTEAAQLVAEFHAKEK